MAAQPPPLPPPGPPPLPRPKKPTPEEIRARYREFIESRLDEDHEYMPGVMRPIAIAISAVACTIRMSFDSIKVYRSSLRIGTLRGRAWKDFASRAVPVTAYPVMVNHALRSAGSEDSAGLVVVSFDAPPEAMESWFFSLSDFATGSEQATPELRSYVDKLCEEEAFTVARRRKIPTSLTGGLNIYACDLWIPRKPLRAGVMQAEALDCVAEPGDAGRINVLPWWIAEGVEPPSVKFEPGSTEYGVPFRAEEQAEVVRIVTELRELAIRKGQLPPDEQG